MKESGLTDLSRRVAVALQSTKLPGKQQGASALEYIVLAAAIIIIVGWLATDTTVRTTLVTAFQGLFTDAASGGADGGG
ncbi:hypothetical protein [Marinobacter sp. SS21]|uniref:hypothetical protein n=1 Tax=Marinobacter sp. SS21 TaxID=2979460 RepID=UPI00232F8AB9|nr:hypothetical protein [Marinobacter sp. SS21]MDC0661249.1 hypothetical protein [Marinobacter sp. SS21]